MSLTKLLKSLTSGFRGAAVEPQKSVPLAPTRIEFSGPEDVVFPGDKASLEEHARFLIEAKAFIRSQPVPPERAGRNNQYSHSRGAPIGDDISASATTNCSYEFYGRKLISIGFPLFTPQAPIIKDNKVNPAFNVCTFWESFEKILEHEIGYLGDGDVKFGYYLPTNHSYIELPVPDDVFARAEPIIELYVRANITDPKEFLRAVHEISLSRREASHHPEAGIP